MKRIRVKGDAMESIRVRKGYNVRQLARVIKKDSAALYRIESGVSNAMPGTAKAICDALGQEFDDIFEMVEE